MRPAAVAIIGLACRFPGAATPAEFWRLLRDGREASQLPYDAAEFDADFFRISPREARAMDPRQRLALELTWECLEDAFVKPETLRGQHVSVYLGAMNDDYAVLALSDTGDDLDHHTFAGLSRGMIANKISYVFGLHGASMTVDSGQSSSLVAVHLACESLRSGESTLAVAGGIHLNLASETAALEREFGALSPTGHTYAFDARADGYVRGEGGAVLLLKPLDAALNDGDRIHAIIRGGSVGNAGHSTTAQTVPSATAQTDVVRRALTDAGLRAGDIQYVEAHGTGTEVGDPVELAALGEVFADRQQHPVTLGSVKTNIGHAGAAAGVAGLLKAVLAIENAEIPPSLNYTRPKPGIDMKGLGVQVGTTLTPWRDQPRRAGVSSFGMGGTNAHLIIEQAPPQAPAPKVDANDGNPDIADVPWVLSARSAAGLAGQAQKLLTHCDAHPELRVADVGWSLISTRSVFEHRAVVTGADRDTLLAASATLAAGEPAADVVTGTARSLGKTVLVFPGQGAQWLGMGRQLHQRFPAFARAFDEAAQALNAHLRLPLSQVLWGEDATLLENTEFAQPALFAVEVALAELLRSFGMVPDFVIGHSVGEISAAHVAGVLSLADAAKVVATRARLMAGLPAGGVMIAVSADEDEVLSLLQRGVCIAAVNAPDSVVISGAAAAAEALADHFAKLGRRVNRLAVSHAFHSELMEPMVEPFAAALTGISVAQPRVGLISNMTGELAGAGYGSPEYWAAHVRRPVRFADGVRTLASLGARVFVESGPAAGLIAAVQQSFDPDAAVVTMAKDRPETTSALTAIGALFAAGVNVDWGSTFDGVDVRRVELPTYAFQRRRFWLGTTPEAAPNSAVDDEGAASFAEWWRALGPAERVNQLVELVCTQAAMVLGHSSGQDVSIDSAFQDLGFDSMAGVNLRNRLKSKTGLPLSRTLIFDYPTPIALAAYLAEQLSDNPPDESDDEKIRSLLMRIPIQELRKTGLLDKLLALAAPEKDLLTPIVNDEVIDSLSPDALIAMALNIADSDENA
ncbi:polyketide synthase [Mycobacterium intermedium]|uniref:Polyketide synthase n=1 Tax=Mycobacterium intermedium TaxID=28445 RepID=A0A1E3SMW7_MYCIE|nr:type I polyketide synthase [Mycobacterium intermedium]MCV6967096.1 type I polyketide synthase [Mycobacterium intermedium]ODR03471.1 polyketide synthase [Mycobacterium intermedium]OPE53003.1 polyketide synthase [Mycobacterium intermedium]ORB05167.1 polyketide synthase [Mycobacterium intermedium]